jgi:hypothetical protein
MNAGSFSIPELAAACGGLPAFAACKGQEKGKLGWQANVVVIGALGSPRREMCRIAQGGSNGWLEDAVTGWCQVRIDVVRQ